MLTRRNMLAGAGATLAIPNDLYAAATCAPVGLPVGYCSVLLDPSRFSALAVAAAQERSQWCWAACIQMICKWHGIRLSQDSIVNRIFGGIVNMPANHADLTKALNSDWTSDDDEEFSISAEIFSTNLKKANVDNNRAITDLANDRPLLNGSRTHATVVARIDYVPTYFGPQVGRVHVIDPWPGATSPPWYARFLEIDEMTAEANGGSLRYLASVSIEK
jgi:hypothetical protein